MKITIKDCDLFICKHLDKWLINKDIVNNAMLDQSFTDEYNYYHDKNNKFSEKVFQKAFYIDNLLIAYVTLMYYEEDGKYEAAINPFVINPDYHNIGYGKNILRYIINNIEAIAQGEVDYLVATISIQNVISLRLFNSLGFERTGESLDKTYIYYKFKNN